MRDLYFKNGNAFTIVYSVTAANTFEEAKKIYPQMVQCRGGDDDPLPVVLVGNKIDLEKKRTVSTKAGKEVANLWQCKFLETSAKENINITEIFTGMVDEIWRLNGIPMMEKKKRGCRLF